MNGHGRREFLLGGAGLLTPVYLARSATLLRCANHPEGSVDWQRAMRGFSTWPGTWQAFSQRTPVYVSNTDGPPVLVLHELPGLTPFDIDFAARLAARGFRVYLPLLFGAPGDNKFSGYFWSQCVAGEWPWADKAPRNPWAAPLRELCVRIEGERQQPIGVVGMCLTGILPVSLMAESSVRAGVISQPTLPFPFDAGRRRALGLADEEIAYARRRLEVENLTLLAFRASSDCFCPSDRFDAMRAAFGRRVDARTIDYGQQHGHSILAAEYHRRDLPHAVKREVSAAFDMTVAYLHRHIG